MARNASTLLLVIGLSLTAGPTKAEPVQYPYEPYPIRPPALSPPRGGLQPRGWFDVNTCLRYCDGGDPGAMEAYCRQSTQPGTRARALCWEAVNELETGNIPACQNRCFAIAGDRYYRP